MLIINVVVVSGTLLAGYNPNAAAMVYDCHFRFHKRPPWMLLADFYKGVLQPVTNYDRGVSKWNCFRKTLAARNHSWWLETISINPGIWVMLCLAASFLTLYPAVVAYSLTHRLPWPGMVVEPFPTWYILAVKPFLS